MFKLREFLWSVPALLCGVKVVGNCAGLVRNVPGIHDVPVVLSPRVDRQPEVGLREGEGEKEAARAKDAADLLKL
jgi:hypothetical protein